MHTIHINTRGNMRKEEIIKLAQQIVEGKCEPEELWGTISQGHTLLNQFSEPDNIDDEGKPTWDDEFEYHMRNL